MTVFLNKLMLVVRKPFEDVRLAAALFIVAVVLALIKSRAEEQG